MVVCLPGLQPPQRRPDQIVGGGGRGRLQGPGQVQPQPPQPQPRHVGADHLSIQRMRHAHLGTAEPIADADQPGGLGLLQHGLADNAGRQPQGERFARGDHLDGVALARTDRREPGGDHLAHATAQGRLTGQRPDIATLDQGRAAERCPHQFPQQQAVALGAAGEDACGTRVHRPAEHRLQQRGDVPGRHRRDVDPFTQPVAPEPLNAAGRRARVPDRHHQRRGGTGCECKQHPR